MTLLLMFLLGAAVSPTVVRSEARAAAAARLVAETETLLRGSRVGR